MDVTDCPEAKLFLMEPADHDLAAALAALNREIGGLCATVARNAGLTTQQANLLCLAAHHQPSFGELAAALGCDKTNVTGLVDRLERRALVRREVDAQDRRVTRVVLTEAGSALGVRLRAEFTGSIAEHLGDWPADDRRQFLRLAGSAAQTLSDAR